MMKQLTTFFMISSRLVRILGLLFALAPQTVQAWTSASISDVDVTVEIAADGPSRVVTEARYLVDGGKFHGFDLTDLSGAELVEEECRATLDDGRYYALSFRQLRDGRTRVILAGGAEVKRGAVTFLFVHKVDLLKLGALRWYEGRARLDWTPLIWDEGLHVMKIHVVLPGKSSDAPIIVDSAVTRDYEVAIQENRIDFVKYRPVRWYPMQIVADFDPALIPAVTKDDEKEPAPALARTESAPPSNTPRHIEALPAVVVILGLIALILKGFHVRRVCGHLGIATRFRLLPATGLPLRVVLSVSAAALGVGAQYFGSLAAGVPALVVAASLWLARREQGSLRVRPSGGWRKMDDEDCVMYYRLARTYRRCRTSFLDITTPGGILAFGAVLGGLGYIVFLTKVDWPRIGWAAVINGSILAVPAWFANVRAELPVDTMLEGFLTLRKWRRSLARLVGTKKSGAGAEYWVREDEHGPVEVRLRVNPPPEGLNGIEIAGEVLRSGSLYKTRTAVVLRIEPGTVAARRLATCPHAVEHHLTPDLKEEIIVLRNRRGRTPGLAPLRAALALLSS
ncbi:MAG: hypothetical protein GY854_07590 [Deltaproteobacteria bacterium]|nr:hypothetical protein [Deltaproteobacteria bacterium]